MLSVKIAGKNIREEQPPTGLKESALYRTVRALENEGIKKLQNLEYECSYSSSMQAYILKQACSAKAT